LPIDVLDRHKFGVEVIGFSAGQALTRLAPSTARVQVGMMSVSWPAGNAKHSLVTIRYKEQQGRTPTGGSADVSQGGEGMDIVAVRVFTFSILPVIIAAAHLGLDRSSRPRERRLEIFLLYLFGVGVAGSGVGGFFGHFFISDSVAESIGWPTGNPFQLEVGFANLAVGILGIVAMGRRDGFREATVIAVTVLA
jgi:hypothetical protein